jgi:hypothetical protein
MRTLGILGIAFLLGSAGARTESVRVSVPDGLTFSVADVSAPR